MGISSRVIFRFSERLAAGYCRRPLSNSLPIGAKQYSAALTTPQRINFHLLGRHAKLI
jgi:hypothetical protein